MFPYKSIFFFSFFGYELLVFVCFFLFLFFGLLADVQVTKHLQELSSDARIKLNRHLTVRENMIKDLIAYLDTSVLKMKKLPTLYGIASKEIILRTAQIAKTLPQIRTVMQIQYYLDNTATLTQSLALQIRLYLTKDFFVYKRFSGKALDNNALGTKGTGPSVHGNSVQLTK